jgi:tetratricopeptide (TPR) repeat protein
VADLHRRRLHGAVLSTTAVRLVGGLIVLAVYTAVLHPARSAASGDGAAAEQWLAASRDAFESGRYADALQPTLALTEAFSNQQVYAQRLALIYQQLGRRAEEAAVWERVVNISPTPVEACPALPDAYVAAGAPDRALDAFERCLGFDPRNTDMMFYLGRFHERAGRRDRAAELYRDAIRIEPKAADSRLGLARLDLNAGRLAEAESAARGVLSSSPDNVDALLVAGLAAQRQGKRHPARQDLTRALTLAERYVDVHVALGILEYSDGRVAEAGRHFRRAVEIEPARRPQLAEWLARVEEQPQR